MKKSLGLILLTLTLISIMSPLCFAEEAAAATAGKSSNIFYYAMAALGCGLGIGLAALGTGIGQGIGLGGACEGVARNPGASGKITTTLIIGLAMILIAYYAGPDPETTINFRLGSHPLTKPEFVKKLVINYFYPRVHP